MGHELARGLTSPRRGRVSEADLREQRVCPECPPSCTAQRSINAQYK